MVGPGKDATHKPQPFWRPGYHVGQGITRLAILSHPWSRRDTLPQ